MQDKPDMVKFIHTELETSIPIHLFLGMAKMLFAMIVGEFTELYL